MEFLFQFMETDSDEKTDARLINPVRIVANINRKNVEKKLENIE